MQGLIPVSSLLLTLFFIEPIYYSVESRHRVSFFGSCSQVAFFVGDADRHVSFNLEVLPKLVLLYTKEAPRAKRLYLVLNGSVSSLLLTLFFIQPIYSVESRHRVSFFGSCSQRRKDS